MDQAVIELLEGLKEEVKAEDVYFRRDVWMVTLCLLTWGLFWAMAERHQENAHAQFLTWLAMFLAFSVVNAL